MSLTPSQQDAIAARGNVLVVAGAGTGKTRTLVERCLDCLMAESPAASLDELLLVTFTDAAAAEMRQRIRVRLERMLAEEPSNRWAREQLALFDNAHIGTLHSFCLQLVRQHFYELHLDPQLAILSPEEGPLLEQETLDRLLEQYYSGAAPDSQAVQRLIELQSRGEDKLVRQLLLRLHRYAQTLPDPDGWFAAQAEMFETTAPITWREWFAAAVQDWHGRWLPLVQQYQNPVAKCCATALSQLGSRPGNEVIRTVTEAVANSLSFCQRGKKKYWVDPLKDFFDEAEFLGTLVAGPEQEPLLEDWRWVREEARTLVKLGAEFSAAYAEAKRELGVLDFQDIEQYALKLLWDRISKRPTKVAELWRRKLRYVFVDEYQDINAAQDRIIECLSRNGDGANRFLVGDVKQSIYRFRLANPRIFQGYVESWAAPPSRVIPLRDNFRSREGILNFVNSLFPGIMRRELGGVDYDALAQLSFGNPKERAHLAAEPDLPDQVEWLLRQRSGSNSQSPSDPETNGGDGLDSIEDLEETTKEARMVALRLRMLHEGNFQVWDERISRFRNVKWSDMAVLLRSPGSKSDRYAKEFARTGVPLSVARGEFYASMEIADLLSLLTIVDNPLQDIPAIAVLRSPMVGLSLDQLSELRLSSKGRFWTAALEWHKAQQKRPASERSLMFQRVDDFLGNYRRWRRIAREVSLCRCLEVVLAETRYESWLLTQSRGEERRSNLQRFLSLAKTFDRFQRQSLYRFLCFVESQMESGKEPEVSSRVERDTVRLLSIHQSKGLEFPVVVVADLGKTFNTDDLYSEVILDEVYGLCPQVKPPGKRTRYPSLPHWLASRRQLRELLGEELRLLYVAVTRARDFLLLAGTLSKKQVQVMTQPPAISAQASQARSYADWLVRWFAQTRSTGGAQPTHECSPEEAVSLPSAGENEFLRLRCVSDADLLLLANSREVVAPEPEQLTALTTRIQALNSWTYPFLAETRVPAKSSVTALRRRFASASEQPVWTNPTAFPSFLENRSRTSETPEFIGNAHHAFLEFVSLDKTTSVQQLRAEATRLVQGRLLTERELQSLDFEALHRFWRSDFGSLVVANTGAVRRELPFTARFSSADLTRMCPGGANTLSLSDGEFVVVQGVADLVLVLPDALTLVDFKTDAVGDLAQAVNRYAPQLRLYAAALSRIYGRPVSRAALFFLMSGETAVVDC